MLQELGNLKNKRIPFWLAPFVGAAVGGIVGLRALERDSADWKMFALAFAGIGFVAGLIVCFADVARAPVQLTPIRPPPLPSPTVSARRVTTAPLSPPSNTFVVAPRTGVFAFAGAFFMLLGAAFFFMGLSFLFGWITPQDDRSPVLPGVVMSLAGPFVMLFGFAQFSTSLVRGRPILIGFREGLCVRIVKPRKLDDVPFLPDYVSTLIDMFTGTAWQASHVVLAWQSLQFFVDGVFLKRTLLLTGRQLDTSNTQVDPERYQVEIDETGLGTDPEEVLRQLQHIANSPEIQQTLPRLPATLPS